MEQALVSNIDDPFAAKATLAALIFVVALTLSLVLQYPLKGILKLTDSRRGAGTVVRNVIRILVWGWAICEFVAVCLEIDVAGIVGALGVVGIAISLGAQQTIANIIGGLIIALSSLIGPGDWITIPGQREARVVDTNWRRTTMKDEDGLLYTVPNAFMVSNSIEVGHPYYTIIIPFTLKVDTPDVEGLLVDCEQALLDRMIEKHMDYKKMRPIVGIAGTTLGAIKAEAKIYANRSNSSRVVKRAVLPALIELLQEREALAEVSVIDPEAA